MGSAHMAAALPPLLARWLAAPPDQLPGDGNMPLERLVGWVLEAGYRGSWEFELIGPRIEKEGVAKATARSAAWMTSLLQRLGA